MSGRGGTALTLEDDARQGKENQIFSACTEGDLGLIKKLVYKNKKLINTPDGTGRTPLYYTCTRGRKRTVDVLLQRGADFNTMANRNILHETVLEYSRAWKRYQQLSDIIIQTLIDAGADFKHRSVHRSSPFEITTKKKIPWDKFKEYSRQVNILRVVWVWGIFQPFEFQI